MISTDLQHSRYEMKYLIDERCADDVRRTVRIHLQPDKYAPAPGAPYAVHSLYLDDDQMSLCNATLDGLPKRFKLRMRWYDNEGPIFCEVKSRIDRVIRKDRAKISRKAAIRIAAGASPSLADLAGGSSTEFQRFAALRDRTDAIGRIIVSYDREAWVTEQDNSSRVTFDRRLSGSRYSLGSDLRSAARPFYARMGGVILELKFTGRFPLWMAEMVRDLNLVRVPVPKYVTCTQSLSSSDFRRAHLAEI